MTPGLLSYFHWAGRQVRLTYYLDFKILTLVGLVFLDCLFASFVFY
jgi:hypothetical protein